MPTEAKKVEKHVYVSRPMGPDGPRVTTVRTNKLTAVFSGRVPLFITADFDPPDEVPGAPSATGEWWAGLVPMLRTELGDEWFDGTTVATNDNTEVITATSTKFLTVVSAWWALTRMSNSHATFAEFLQMVASNDPLAHKLGDELATRLATLTADLLDRFPEAVLSAETTEFIEKLVSAMELEAQS